MRRRPPGRGSSSHTGFVNPWGPHHSAICSGSVHAEKTRASGCAVIASEDEFRIGRFRRLALGRLRTAHRVWPPVMSNGPVPALQAIVERTPRESTQVPRRNDRPGLGARLGLALALLRSSAKVGLSTRGGSHDRKAEVRRISALLAEAGSKDGK